MRAQISLEMLLLFGLFMIIIGAALVGIFSLKQQTDYQSQAALMYSNLEQLFNTFNNLRVSCPSKDVVQLRFIKETTLEIVPLSRYTMVKVSSGDVGEIVLLYDGQITRYSERASTFNLRLECSNGIIEVNR